MSLVTKKFENTELGISINVYIDDKQEIWFKGRDIALALGYERPRNAISTHVDEENRKRYRDLKGPLRKAPLETSNRIPFL